MTYANVGRVDRFFRVLIGAVLLIGFVALPEASARWVLLVGTLPLLTGLTAFCPVYAVFNFSTRVHGARACPPT